MPAPTAASNSRVGITDTEVIQATITKMISQLGSSEMAVSPIRRIVQLRDRAARGPVPRRGEAPPPGEGLLVPSGEPRRDDERGHQHDHGDDRDDGPDAANGEPAADAAPRSARRSC